MLRPARFLFTACLTMTLAATWPERTTAAEGEAQVQDLAQVRATSWVTTAQWSRRPDSYVLQVVLDASRFARERAAANPATPVPTRQLPRPAPPRDGVLGIAPDDGRGSLFIGNTIANLRGLDPVLSCGRVLTLVSGRRTDGPSTPTPPEPSYINQPYPARYVDRRVEVWLLKANGTQILPATYSCDAGRRGAPTPPPVEITYEFPLAEGAQAVAVAVRIGDNFYIEKLQPQAPAPAVL